MKQPFHESATIATAGTLGPSDILSRLKRETSERHARLDALVAPMLGDLSRYRDLIISFRDAQWCIERQLASYASALASVGYDVASRSKLRWLDEDLAALSAVGADTHALPSAAFTGFSLADAASALGAVYVIEGATLGGQVIARMVTRSLALTPATGCRYFTGYGERTRDRWIETREAIEAYASSTLEHSGPRRIIAGARDTFDFFEQSVHAVSAPSR